MTDITKDFISLNGILSDKALEKLNVCNSSNSAWFFVGYSELDVPKGTLFNKAFNSDGDFICSVKAEITSITQELNVQWDFIPKGWKTICEIRFEEGLSKIEECMDKTDTWFVSDKKVLLYGGNG